VTVPQQVAALEAARVIVALATHEGPVATRADVVLPVSSWAESDGTFVNAKGLAQESEKAIAPLGDSRPGWKVVTALARELGKSLAWKKLSEIRAAMAPEMASRRPSVRPPSIRPGALE
jgi:NADH-quinone oxidoreductase subunit G